MPGRLVAMPGALPEGESVPARRLAARRRRSRAVGARGFGVYVHVPFCASRCGYCDFNTYTAAELGGGASREAYADTVLAELALAARVLGDTPPPRVDTVFVGGGTPTLLPADDLARILDGIDRTWGLAADAEVTTEANPESVDPGVAEGAAGRRLHPDLAGHAVRRAAGCWRSWTAGTPPGRAAAAAREARDAGFDHVNLDLIYGTPGERAEDFAASLDAGRRRRGRPRQRVRPDRGGRHPARRPDAPGRAAVPDDDVAADRYLAAEARADRGRASPGTRCPTGPARRRPGAGTTCSTGPAATGGGSGPGAHSHVGGVRWWNVKHPTAYAQRLAAGESPGQARELLTADERAHGGRDAAAAAGRRAAAGGAGRRPAGPAPSGRSRAGCWTPTAYARGPGGADPARPAARRRGGPRPAALTGAARRRHRPRARRSLPTGTRCGHFMKLRSSSGSWYSCPRWPSCRR